MLLKRWMEIRKTWLMVALAIIVMHLVLLSAASAQELVEAAEVRGHTSNGDGIWSARDFGWFYYDPDTDTGGEQLKIGLQGRSAKKGQIVYTSKAWSRQFEYEPWGSYHAVAFFGRIYLAGYPESPFTEDVSSLAKGELRRILIDEKERLTLSYNRTLPLAQGYELAAVETSSKEGGVNFILSKDGRPIYVSVVSIGDTFTYKVNDVPVILVHLARAMKGEDSGFAEVDGIFQISDLPDIKLFDGGKLGNMELLDFSEDGIEFRNSISITLTRNHIIPLTTDLAIIVLDQPDLIYYPVGTIFDYGVHEIRGPIFDASSVIPVVLSSSESSALARWNSQNYSGFYFDPAKSLGDETLTLHNIQGRRVTSIFQNISNRESDNPLPKGFQYTTLIQPREFEFDSWGRYFVISFLGSQWFAGYDSSTQGQKATKSLLEREYLGKVLVDMEPQGIVLAGNYSLLEGYEMRILDVGNDSIFLQLLKNGVPVDNSVVNTNSTYVYKKDLGDVKELPIIMVHLNNVFKNETNSFATIDGVFQISDQNIMSIEPGLGLENLKIVSVQPFGIFMFNDDYINLNRDSIVTLGPGMNLRVADSDDLRYYLYTASYVVPRPRPPLINKPGNITSGEAANFSLVVQAGEIRRVTADILDSSNKTVFVEDVTASGQGSRDVWGFGWTWDATTLQLSDDRSPILNAGEGSVPGLLFLNQSTPPVQVRVIFNSTGRISRIMSINSVYYVTRSEFNRINVDMDYDAMLANETTRNMVLKIEPGKSILQFYDVIDGRLVPSGINHTLQGTMEALEPHAVKVGAKPGRYELRVRVENAVNAIQAFGEFFNVTPAEMRGISLGSAEIFAGDSVTIPLEAPANGSTKRIDISYDANMLRAEDIAGECKPTWQVDANAGTITVLLPEGCGAANLTFAARNTAAENENVTVDLNITGTSGLNPETVTNGSISIAADGSDPRKSNALGIVAAIAAFVAGAYARRRG
jgi:S-layer protein (TIGR01567 family)